MKVDDKCTWNIMAAIATNCINISCRCNCSDSVDEEFFDTGSVSKRNPELSLTALIIKMKENQTKSSNVHELFGNT